MGEKKNLEYCFVHSHVLHQHLTYLNVFNYSVYSVIEVNSTLKYLCEEVRKGTKLISVEKSICSEKCFFSNSQDIY